MAAVKTEAVKEPAESTTGSTPSERFERGELDIDGYLDALVSQSIALVAGKLSADRVEWLRGMIREQLTTDPVVRERVRQATGRELQLR